ncbi:restriction modification system DNA specificity domain-containing protein [Salinisphaera shabanensis T35B1]|uniref:restriction endonuclease subunit S n=1 Tax=Salinisphaera shabanensis TaxID=180542 RepID=UPI0033404D98
MSSAAKTVREPNAHRRVKLAELVEFRRGLTYKKRDEVDQSSNAVLRANNIDLLSGRLDLGDIRYIDAAIDVPAGKKLEAGSILICTASGSRSHLGKAAYIDSPMDYAFGGFMGLLVPCNALYGKYLHYFMRSVEYWQFLEGLAGGTNINNLKFRDLGELTVPIPEIDEQKRIVAVLDQAFAALDRVSDHTQTNIDNSVSLFESWLKLALNLGEHSWPIRRLSQIAENLDRKRVPITKKDRKKGTIPYYGASGVVDYVADHIFDEDLLLISEDGANLLARTYPIAFSISGKSWVNNHAHVLRFDDFDSQEFVQLYLNSISIAPFVSGMAQPKLNQKALGQIEIPYPPLEERKRFVAAAAAVWQRAQSAKCAYEQRLANTNSLKESLLQRAFAGKLA